jgi:hypothetical protein
LLIEEVGKMNDDHIPNIDILDFWSEEGRTAPMAGKER